MLGGAAMRHDACGCSECVLGASGVFLVLDYQNIDPLESEARVSKIKNASLQNVREV